VPVGEGAISIAAATKSEVKVKVDDDTFSFSMPLPPSLGEGVEVISKAATDCAIEAKRSELRDLAMSTLFSLTLSFLPPSSESPPVASSMLPLKVLGVNILGDPLPQLSPLTLSMSWVREDDLDLTTNS